MLSKSAKYTFKALSILGDLQPGEYLGAAVIGEKLGIPQNYLGKLLQNLAKTGIVVSQKGLGGGFRLSGSPEDITLYEVVEAINEEDHFNKCFWDYPVCTKPHPCPMHKRWKPVAELTKKTFKTTTVADLQLKEQL